MHTKQMFIPASKSNLGKPMKNIKEATPQGSLAKQSGFGKIAELSRIASQSYLTGLPILAVMIHIIKRLNDLRWKVVELF